MLWNAKGSTAKISEFFVHENPTAKVLDHLLRDMKLRLDHNPSSSCSLGSGRLRKDFRVCADDGRGNQGCMALQVVAGSENIRRLGTEYSNNKEVCRRRPGMIVKAIAIRCYTEACNEVVGAGMLMEEVGSAVSRIDSEKNLAKSLTCSCQASPNGVCAWVCSDRQPAGVRRPGQVVRHAARKNH